MQRPLPLPLVLGVLFAWFVPGCAGPPDRSTGVVGDTAATKAELLAADSALAQATLAGGTSAFLARGAPGAPVLFPGHPILRAGPSVVAPFAERYDAPARYNWRPLHAVAALDGTFGCTIGVSVFRRASGATPTTGMYETCWERGKDGTWVVVGHQRNDSPGEPLRWDSIVGLPIRARSATIARGQEPSAAAREADTRFALLADSAGPAVAFARFAAEDAMLLTPAELPVGPRAIGAVFNGFPASRVLAWRPAPDLGVGRGGLAFTVGHSENRPRTGTGPERHGKFLTIWRQEPDGSWRYIYDLGSPRE